MITPETGSILDRQLLQQLGDRIRRLRQAQGLGTVEVAARASITRNTLRAVETGDPATSIGIYLRVMSILGIGGELALLAGDTLVPAPAGSATARSRRSAPVVEIRVTTDDAQHRLQDLQSILLHEEAVRQAKADPQLVQQAVATAKRWLQSGDSRSADLWREWLKILQARTWRKVLGPTRRAQQLRQASPLITVLPEKLRQDILAQASDLRKGIVLGSRTAPPSKPPARKKAP